MCGTDWDAAEMLDRLVDWFEGHWRSMIYSFFAGAIFTVACSWCSEAHAAGYPKPAGVPEVYVPNYGVTVAVAALHTSIGDGIGVLENNGNGVWTLCGICLVDGAIPNLNADVAAVGGTGPYVASKLAALNNILSARYPEIGGGPVTTLDQVNQALQGMQLRLVNGSPVLGGK